MSSLTSAPTGVDLRFNIDFVEPRLRSLARAFTIHHSSFNIKHSTLTSSNLGCARSAISKQAYIALAGTSFHHTTEQNE